MVLTTSANPPIFNLNTNTNKSSNNGIPDTAATRHYITEATLPICNNVENTEGPYVAVADGQVLAPTKKALLPLSKHLTSKARVAYSFNNLKSGTLISIGQLCDDECVAIFTKYNVKILKGDNN